MAETVAVTGGDPHSTVCSHSPCSIEAPKHEAVDQLELQSPAAKGLFKV